MSLKSIIRDAGYLVLGTAAVVAEKGSEAARHLIRKGGEVWLDNQDTVQNVSRKARDLCEKAKERMQPPPVTQLEAEELTDEERAILEEMRRRKAEEPIEETDEDAAEETAEESAGDDAEVAVESAE